MTAPPVALSASVNMGKCGFGIDGVSIPQLSAFTREQTLRRREPGSTLSGSLMLSDSQTGSLLPGAIPISEAYNAFPRNVSDRLDRFILNLARMQPVPGRGIKVTQRDYSIAYAEDASTAGYLAAQLQNMKWINYQSSDGAFFGAGDGEIVISVEGWNKIAELQRARTGQDTTQVFVAMWFNPDMGNAYAAGLAAGIKAAGYVPLRIDKSEHNNKIDDEIIAEIRKSRFLVADFTGHRGGVYYEAGFALGLGIPVIWTCQKDHLDKAHFDTRQYNHIDWETPEELATRLQQRIEATIGRGTA